MPVFRYEAVDRMGRNMTGMMPANDEANLEDKLRNIGLWLTDANQEASASLGQKIEGSKIFSAGKVKRRELIEFCTLMTFQVRVGVSLVKALEVVYADCKSENFKNVLRGMQTHLESGLQMHEAMARYPKVFSKHFISVVEAGESSSRLPETFDDLRKYLEWVEQVVSDVKQATLYPAIVLTVIAGFTIFLFTFVIPTFSNLMTKAGLELPLLTRIVFGVGDFANATWWIWIPLFLVIIIGIPVGCKLSTNFAYFMDHVKLKLPVFGDLNSMLALSRFSHNLSILYRSGINILRCLELCSQGLIGNKVVERAVGIMEEDVKTGSTITEAMHRHTVFSAMLQRMVSMGESTGNLDKGLDNVAQYYNDVIPRKIKAIFAILEPAIMLFLIFIVGCIALAIYLPIISLMGAIK